MIRQNRNRLCLGIVLVLVTINLSAQQSLWDMDHLKMAPAYHWINADTAKVRQLIYEGEAYGDRPKTEVFAYYATPGSIFGDKSKDHNLPAIVLVHGGGGLAFKEWATLWAQRGYAAIAMDLGGNGADGKPLPNGGPSQVGPTKFSSIDSVMNKQWVYHSVSNVILAHSLICSFSEVNAEKTAITGISWGGFLTCITAGLDERFKAAVPVYGCGFIYLPGGFFYEKEYGILSADQKKRWSDRYDPSHYIYKAKMPFLWVTGTNDVFYAPNMLSRTYNLVRKESNFRITTTMTHGHKQGWAPNEIGLFVDHALLGTGPLPVIKSVKSSSEKVTAIVKTKSKLVSAAISYTIDTFLPYSLRKWETFQASVSENKICAPPLPVGTTVWMINATDSLGSTISSSYFFTNKTIVEE